MNIAPVRVEVPDAIDASTQSQITDLLEIAQTIVVDNDSDYEFAAEQLTQVKAAYKRAEDTRKSITKPLDDAKKAVMELFRTPLANLGNAKSVVERSMNAYQDRVEAERRRIEAEARRAEEAERRRIEAEAAAEAAKLEEAGDAEAAETVREVAREVANTVVAIAPRVEAPTAAGISTRQNYKAEVEDLLAVIKAAAAGDKLALAVLTVDQKALNAQAKALKTGLDIPGVRVYTERTFTARRA